MHENPFHIQMRLIIKKILITLILFNALIVMFSCKKDNQTPPILTTNDPTEITQTTATTGGNIQSDGGAGINIAGVCWSTSSNPTIKDKHTNDTKSPGVFTVTLTDLTPDTKYYIRAYANNDAGTAYGNEVSFTTSHIVVPEITTTEITSITSITAESGGNITSDGGDPVTERGVCWSTDPGPTTDDSKTSNGTGVGSFISIISNLEPVTRYYVRAYAINKAGISYGNELNFTTLATAPVLITMEVSDVTTFTAKSGGTVISNGGGGIISARGICYSILEDPTTEDSKTEDGQGLGPFISNLIDLKANTTYYMRAYATNDIGTGYGNQISFTTRSDTILFNDKIVYGSVRDLDGNVYRTVQAGDQTWMAENLKVTQYNNGEPIPRIMDDSEWRDDLVGGYCYYDNEFSYKYLYGALYNWYTVNTGLLCPSGWHVPAESEWLILADFLNGETEAGGKLKETGFTHWSSPNTGATNETGLTALPGGSRDSDSEFYGIGLNSIWWSASESNVDLAYFHYLSSDEQNIRTFEGSQKNGCSVRCVKD
jgi:uncharacterized protein (TIGR02145 family)